MAYPTNLTTALTGVSKVQLYGWREKGLFTPELSGDQGTGFLYSFQDLVALRTFMWLRCSISPQKIRKAMSTLQEGFNFVEHASSCAVVSDGDSILLIGNGEATDLRRRKGQRMIQNLDDVFKGFKHPLREGNIVNLRTPRPQLEVNERRLGGFPTIRGTRVAYDSVAKLISDGSVSPDDVSKYYAGVNAAQANDALSFYRQVQAHKVSVV